MYGVISPASAFAVSSAHFSLCASTFALVCLFTASAYSSSVSKRSDWGAIGSKGKVSDSHRVFRCHSPFQSAVRSPPLVAVILRVAEIGGGMFVQHINRLVGEIADVLLTKTRGIGAVPSQPSSQNSRRFMVLKGHEAHADLSKR